MKKKSVEVDLKTLWDRHSKARKVGSGSASTPQPVTIESEAVPVSGVPSVQPVTVESQVQIQQPEVAEIDVARNVSPEVASNDPDIASTVAVVTEDEQQQSEPPTWSPIRDGDDSEAEYESSEEAIYDVDLLPHDPGRRIPIKGYDVNERNSVIRGYIALGPCQPSRHKFPGRKIGKKTRRFKSSWFSEFKWLEYSVERDAAFCFVCYLFKHKVNSSGGDAFMNVGFRNWHLKSRIARHVGSMTSFHNMAQDKYNHFIAPKANIVENFAATTEEDKARYISRLTYSIKCMKFLLRQGLAARGHDESEKSLNKGNFLELLGTLAENFEEVGKVVLKNAPRNCKLTAPEIQRQIANCCAKETTKLIIEDISDEYFAILADESSDVYQKEQLALCLRYVDKKGRVVERFLGVVHVENTTSLTLKAAIESLLMDHSLSLSKVRGQGYDGASNMKGHANGLKKLILEECPSAHYVHCFAHQLQLTLVAVAKENPDCVWFFEQLRFLLNILGNSCKKIQMLRVAQAQRIIEELELGDIATGKGLNQEMGLGRPADTRWGSHYKTVMHILSLYPSIRKVLIKIGDDRSLRAESANAQTMLTVFRSYEFVFMAHLLQTILGFTADLNHALQKKDQDIVNAVELIFLTKFQLQALREDAGWDDFVQEVNSFCVKHKIKIPDMDSFYRPVGRDKRFFIKIKNIHRFHVEMFLSVIDRQLQELNERFDEAWLATISLALCKAFDLLDMLKKEEEMLLAVKERKEKDGNAFAREILDERTQKAEAWHHNAANRAPYAKPADPITCATFAQDVLEGRASVSQAHEHKHQPLIFGPASLVGGGLTSERERMAAQVFQPGYRLPTMSIEEAGLREMKMMEKWQERTANMIKEANSAWHKDGSSSAQEDEDAEEAKARAWDDWKDDNPRGAGNKKLTPCG